jgi:DNA polymerase III subunit delta
MRLNPPQLAAALQRGLAPLYLVAGEEPLLQQEALDAIRAAARAKGYSEREALDVERGFDWQRLADTCNSMSLFASLRIVELRLNAAPDTAGAQVLTHLAKAPPSDVLLMVSAGKIDWRARNGGWYAALENAGAAIYAEAMKPQEFSGWLGARLRAAGLDADADAVRLIVERTEGNLLAAQQEVQKLALLHGQGARLSVTDADAAVADSAHFEVFAWINKIMAGDTRGAVRGLAGMRGEGVEPLAILGSLAFALRELAKATGQYARSRNAGSAVEGLRIMKSSQPAYARATERSSPNQVLGWLRRCGQIDRYAKSTGGQTQAWEELLTLVLAASGNGGRGGPNRARNA